VNLFVVGMDEIENACDFWSSRSLFTGSLFSSFFSILSCKPRSTTISQTGSPMFNVSLSRSNGLLTVLSGRQQSAAWTVYCGNVSENVRSWPCHLFFLIVQPVWLFRRLRLHHRTYSYLGQRPWATWNFCLALCPPTVKGSTTRNGRFYEI